MCPSWNFCERSILFRWDKKRTVISCYLQCDTNILHMHLDEKQHFLQMSILFLFLSYFPSQTYQFWNLRCSNMKWRNEKNKAPINSTTFQLKLHILSGLSSTDTDRCWWLGTYGVNNAHSIFRLFPSGKVNVSVLLAFMQQEHKSLHTKGSGQHNVKP